MPQKHQVTIPKAFGTQNNIYQPNTFSEISCFSALVAKKKLVGVDSTLNFELNHV